MKFMNRKEVERSLKDKITITRKEFLMKAMDVMEHPFEDDDIPEEEKAHLSLTFMMTGMLLVKLLNEKLFDENNEE